MIFKRKLNRGKKCKIKRMAKKLRLFLKIGNLAREKNVEFVDLEKC